MKTTVDIPEALMAKLRRRAAAERTTLRSVIHTALRRYLDSKEQPAFRLEDGSFRGDGLAPGIREGDWDQIREIIYEGRGG